MTTAAGRAGAGGGFRWRIALSVLLLAVGVPYAAAIVWLKLHETELVFQAQRSRRPPGALPDAARETTIPLASGVALRGVVMDAVQPAAHPYWILHLHGNADTAFSAGQLRHAAALRDAGFSVLSFDYRGFGTVAGEPSEAHVYEDAEGAYRWLLQQGVAPARIILWGHSLGSGPAVMLAARHPVAGLVLFGAFTSIPDRGAELYPWLPVRWIAGIRFDNLARMPAVHVPVVLVHAATDRTIPLDHGRRLFAAANPPKRWLVLEATHDDGFGGHVDAAYDQLPRVLAVMREVIVPPK